METGAHAAEENKTSGATVPEIPSISFGIAGALPQISRLSPQELDELERTVEERLLSLAGQIQNGELAAVEIGRGNIAFVSPEEAVLFRNERKERRILPKPGAHALPPELAGEAVFFSTQSSNELGDKIFAELGVKKSELTYLQFKDGETSLSVNENVRDKEVFLIAGTSNPVNENFMELCITLDALNRASPKRVTVIMPYFGYARQDRKTVKREPIYAKLAAKLLEESGAHRVILLDIHAEQTIGFFKEETSVDNLRGSSITIPYIRNKYGSEDIIVVYPDVNSAKRMQAYQDYLDAGMAVIHKKRKGPNQLEDMTLLGNVEGKTCMLVDDMNDTSGTILLAANKLMEAKAKKVIACFTHPVFSDKAVDRLLASDIAEIITTDSIPLRRAHGTKIKVLSTAPLFAEAIKRMMQKESLSELSNQILDS